MSQLYLSCSSSSCSSSTLSLSCSIYGFVQCISRKFLIKNKYTIFIKITSNSDCFCHSIYNVIIQWNVKDDDNTMIEEKCLKFLHHCPIRCWVSIHNLKESRIYYKQNRESKVWLFIPDQTYIESLPRSRIPSNCIHECCLSQSFSPTTSSSSSSRSFPVGLIPSIELSLISSHCNGIFLEFERINHPPHHHHHPKCNQHYLLLNIDKTIQSVDKLLYRQNIKLFNVWSFFIDTNHDNNKTHFYALLIPGIYSSSSSTIDTDNKLSTIYSKQTIHCQSDCFHFDEPLNKKKFSLLLHDLNYLFNFCLAYQINSLQYKEEVIHYKENILRNQDCTLSELFKHLLSNLFIQSRYVNFKSYQYAEDFIQFPFISNVQENYQSFNFVKDSIIDLHDIIARLQSIDKSMELNNDSEEICTFSTTDQCFKCIYSSYCTQFIPSKSSSLLSTTMNHLWHVQVCKTLLQIRLHHNKFQQYRRSFKRLIPITSTMTQTTLKNHLESSLYVIGKILWNNTHGCFYLQTVHKSIFNHFCNDNNDGNNNNNNEKDNTVSIPLIFNMNTSDEINVLFLLSDHSLILLKDVQVLYEEENSAEVITSGNCADMPFHSTDSVSSTSRMYIYAKQIIPFQVNYLSESIMDDYGKLREQQQSCTIVLVNLGPLSCCSPEASVDPNGHSPSSNKLLWSYMFAGKFIENNTVANVNAATFNNGSSVDSNLMYLSLTGDLAYRWYYNFQIGYHYQLSWVNINSSTSFNHDQSPLRQLISVSILNNSIPMNRENLSFVNVANLNDIMHERSNYPIGCLLNFEAVILFKQYCSLTGHWILWVTTCSELPKTLSSLNNIDVTTVYKVNLFRKTKLVNNLDIVSLFTTSNQMILYCRFTNFSLSAITPTSSSLASLHLNYTDLSRIIVVNQTNTDSMLDKISTQLSDSLTISLDNEYDNSLIVTKEPKLLISNNYDWIGGSISTGYSNVEGDLLKERINVQATITRCLEFQIYRLSNTAGDDQNDDFANLGICIRFVITDGSGSALVQLGHPFIIPSLSSNGVPCQILSNNDSSSTSPKDNLELARLLLGLNCLIWKRLCCQWKRLLDQGVDLSFNFYEFTNDNTTFECNTSSLSSSSSTSFSSEVTSSNKKYNLIPIKLALKTYLNSPTFLRNCRFTLKYRTKNVPHCHRSTTTSTTSLSNSADHWRLKQINLKDSDNSVYSHDNHLCQQQSVYFVLPPYRLYTLLNVTSHNDDFNEL
ncbi:unnamed protein product [Schistosoma intercalatum]|nr:unnamed protein product [Schistosoma intercalatum]